MSFLLRVFFVSKKTIADLTAFLHISEARTLKSVCYVADGRLIFALVRLAIAAREMRRRTKSERADTALLSAALRDAVARLKMQERAMAARAAASERLSDEIIASLTAGAMVVDEYLPLLARCTRPGRW